MMASTCKPLADSQVKPARHPLSPAERTAKLLAYRPGHSHNFTPIRPTPSKKVNQAGRRFATA